MHFMPSAHTTNIKFRLRPLYKEDYRTKKLHHVYIFSGKYENNWMHRGV